MGMKWTYDKIIEVHKALVDAFKDSKHRVKNGIRDEEAIIKCILKRKKSIPNDIIMNQPFLDGNKRTAYLIWRMMAENSFDHETILEREMFWLRLLAKAENKS